MQGTKDHMLSYMKPNHLKVIGYLDSDHANYMDTRKSTFGYLFMMIGGDTSWTSTKLYVIATCIKEAQFMACFKATVHGLYCETLFQGLELSTVLRQSSFQKTTDIR